MNPQKNKNDIKPDFDFILKQDTPTDFAGKAPKKRDKKVVVLIVLLVTTAVVLLAGFFLGANNNVLQVGGSQQDENITPPEELDKTTLAVDLMKAISEYNGKKVRAYSAIEYPDDLGQIDGKTAGFIVGLMAEFDLSKCEPAGVDNAKSTISCLNTEVSGASDKRYIYMEHEGSNKVYKITYTDRNGGSIEYVR